MKPIAKDDASALREAYLRRIKGWMPAAYKPAAMHALGDAIEEYNRYANGKVTCKCSRCGAPSIKGEYRNGRRLWICVTCLAKEDECGKNGHESEGKKSAQGRESGI